MCTCAGETSHDFTQNISYGCLQELVSWAKVKQQELKSNTASGTVSAIHTDLTGIIHTCIRQIQKCTHTASSSTSIQSVHALKTNLPALCHLNR